MSIVNMKHANLVPIASFRHKRKAKKLFKKEEAVHELVHDVINLLYYEH